MTHSNGHGAVYWGKGNPRETLVTFVFLISSTNSFTVVSTCGLANETVARWAMSTNQSERRCCKKKTPTVRLDGSVAADA